MPAVAEPTVEQPVAVKICSACFDVKPLTEFRNRTSGKLGKASECADCHRRRQREWRRSTRIAHEDKAIRKFFHQVAKLPSDRTVRALVRRSVAQFGGPMRLGLAWGRIADQAQARGDLRLLGDYCLAMMRLIDYFTAHPEPTVKIVCATCKRTASMSLSSLPRLNGRRSAAGTGNV